MPNSSVYLPEGTYRKIVKDSEEWNLTIGRAIRVIVESYYEAREKEEKSSQGKEGIG